MRDATRLVRSKQILQSHPEDDKPGTRKWLETSMRWPLGRAFAVPVHLNRASGSKEHVHELFPRRCPTPDQTAR